MVKKPKTVQHARSAKTGKYVTKKAAKKHPSTTVVETDKVRPRTAAKTAVKRKTAAKTAVKRKAAGKTVQHARSAKTGKYVTKKAAKKHPSTTVVETDKVRPRTAAKTAVKRKTAAKTAVKRKTAAKTAVKRKAAGKTVQHARSAKSGKFVAKKAAKKKGSGTGRTGPRKRA